MGVLASKSGTRRCQLSTRTLIGRSRRADLRLDDDAVSNEHASVWWDGAGWRIRDLASRNGTSVSGKRLAPGEGPALAEGAEVSFGGAEPPWIVASVDAPRAFARALDNGQTVDAVGEMLVLPDDDDPQITVYRDVDGRWIAETPEGAAPVHDQGSLVVGAAVWRLHLPEDQRVTTQRVVVPTIESIHLSFRVSLDEEDVHVVAQAGALRIDLKSRAHHYLLLVLARQRATDREDPSLGPSSHGWLYTDELLQMLRVDEAKLNLAVFRARRQFAGAGIEGAASLIERRPGSRQIRLGVDRFSIERG